MPIERKSLYKVLISSRLIGTTRPVMVLVGDTSHRQIPFSEHYIFHAIPDMPFLYRRTGYTCNDAVGAFDEFPEVFAPEALLASETQLACDHFEYELSQRHRDFHRQVFCYGTPPPFEDVDDRVLVEFRIRGLFARELQTMFDHTRATSLAALRERLAIIPTFTIRKEPNA